MKKSKSTKKQLKLIKKYWSKIWDILNKETLKTAILEEKWD